MQTITQKILTAMESAGVHELMRRFARHHIDLSIINNSWIMLDIDGLKVTLSDIDNYQITGKALCIIPGTGRSIYGKYIFTRGDSYSARVVFDR